MSESGEKLIDAPFSIIIDSREQKPYTFECLYENADKGNARIVVPTIRAALEVGDYSLFGYANLITLERKSKSDLYQSVSQNRDNFIKRLERMREFAFSAVVVESSWDDLLIPPKFTQFSPKSLSRTIQAWMVRFPVVHWLMVPDRDWGEAFTFRILQRFWLDRQGDRE